MLEEVAAKRAKDMLMKRKVAPMEPKVALIIGIVDRLRFVYMLK